MTHGKTGAVCAALALAAHAALLIGTPWPQGAATSTGSGAPVTARYVVETAPAQPVTGEAPSPIQDAPAESPPPSTTTPHDAAATPDAQAQAQPDREPPAFDAGGAPQLSFPDAPLAAGGVRVLAYVALEADGSLHDMTTGNPPGAATPPAGFQKAAERALRQARFKPGLGSAYCLLVTFEPDAPAPRLAWLPGAARDAGRCLTGAMPAPRELEVMAAP